MNIKFKLFRKIKPSKPLKPLTQEELTKMEADRQFYLKFYGLLEDFAFKFHSEIVPYGRAGSDEKFAEVAWAFEKFSAKAHNYLWDTVSVNQQKGDI